MGTSWWCRRQPRPQSWRPPHALLRHSVQEACICFSVSLLSCSRLFPPASAQRIHLPGLVPKVALSFSVALRHYKQRMLLHFHYHIVMPFYDSWIFQRLYCKPENRSPKITWFLYHTDKYTAKYIYFILFQNLFFSKAQKNNYKQTNRNIKKSTAQLFAQL